MRTTASHDGKTASTESVNAKKPTRRMSVPVIELDPLETIALGFRQDMFDITDQSGKTLGQMSTGSGYGTDAIILRWGDRHALIRGRDLFRIWVRRFDPEAAKRLPR